MAKFTSNTQDLKFLDAEEKKVMKTNGTVFSILSVSQGAGFEGKGRAWKAVVQIDDEVRMLGLGQVGQVDSRDLLCDELQTYFANEEEPEPVEAYIEQAGRATLLRLAS